MAVETQDTGTGVLLGLFGLCALGGLGYVLLRERKPSEEPFFKPGDRLWCQAGGDPGYFTITERRAKNSSWEYHVWEGSPGFDDLGWWSQTALLTQPWACSIA